MESMSGASWVTLAVGALANLGAIVGLVVSLAKPTRPTRLGFSALGLVLSLATLVVTWLGYLHERSLGAAAAAAASPEVRADLWVASMAECARGVGLGFWLCALPAVASVVLLAWGLVTPGAETPEPRPAQLILILVGVFGLAAGLGLALWAVADYVQYGDFFAMFLMSA